MSDTFKKKLAFEDALAVVKLGGNFSVSEVSKFTAIKINERIVDFIRKNTKSEPAFDENGLPILDEKKVQKIKLTPPENVEVEFSRAELDGFFIGVKETIQTAGVSASDVTMIGHICSLLGMNTRFVKYADSVLASIKRDPSQLDSEIVDTPLD